MHSHQSIPTLPSPLPLPRMATLGQEFPLYRPIYARADLWIDACHESIAKLPVDGALVRGDVQGFLRPADALLLYEASYFARGDVLELGSAWGLSTSILCKAIRGSGRAGRVASIEIDPNFQNACLSTIRSAQLEPFFESLAGSASELLPALIRQGRQFGMVFVDHDHRSSATVEACRALEHLLAPGGFAVFHDFNDARNRDEPEVYGVFQGVSEWLGRSPGFAYVGIVGCCGLVQRRPT